MDLWDEIVGIPLDLWVAADTTKRVRDLITIRDGPGPTLMVDGQLPRDFLPSSHWDRWSLAS